MSWPERVGLDGSLRLPIISSPCPPMINSYDWEIWIVERTRPMVERAISLRATFIQPFLSTRTSKEKIR